MAQLDVQIMDTLIFSFFSTEILCLGFMLIFLRLLILQSTSFSTRPFHSNKGVSRITFLLQQKDMHKLLPQIIISYAWLKFMAWFSGSSKPSDIIFISLFTIIIWRSSVKTCSRFLSTRETFHCSMLI